MQSIIYHLPDSNVFVGNFLSEAATGLSREESRAPLFSYAGPGSSVRAGAENHKLMGQVLLITVEMTAS